MTLAIADAEAILRSRLGEPAKPSTDYVVGFKTPSGKVLAIHREATETRIWFQPPAPPNLDGVHLMDAASNGNSNINGPLLPLRAPTTLRVEVDSPGALNRFLDWYAGPGSAPRAIAAAAAIDPRAFRESFARFQALITARSGHAFTGFHEGLAAVWESYKPRLRDYALGLLRASEWSEADIGSGVILNRMIEAIEIQDMGNARWRRLTEERAGGAKSVFHFDVHGSVAKSTHAGIPWLRFIRQRLGARVHFWPFDGWDIPARRSAIAEVYPALWSRGFAPEGRTGDQHDAFSIAAWLSRADRDGSLAGIPQPRSVAAPNARWRRWRAGYWAFPA
jgi:hypothetical protein